jgi:hypothetical protein
LPQLLLFCNCVGTFACRSSTDGLPGGRGSGAACSLTRPSLFRSAFSRNDMSFDIAGGIFRTASAQHHLCPASYARPNARARHSKPCINWVSAPLHASRHKHSTTTAMCHGAAPWWCTACKECMKIECAKCPMCPVHKLLAQDASERVAVGIRDGICLSSYPGDVVGHGCAFVTLRTKCWCSSRGGSVA